jgi:hypothetical protein
MRCRRRSRELPRVLVVGVTTLALTAVGLPAAQAADGGGSAGGAHEESTNQVASLIDEVGPAVVGQREFAEMPGGLMVDHNEAGGGFSVEAPSTADDAVRIDGGGIELSLPDAVAGAEAAVADDGSVVYTASDRDGVDAQVAPHDKGFRVATVINSPASEHRLDYGVEGAELTLHEDGSISVAREGVMIEPDGSESSRLIEVARVAAPWAYDAVGRPVKTHYEVTAEGFTQVVEPDAATQYPIVADPDWWKIASCTGAIAFFVASTMFAAAKILKVKRYIKALGGTKEAVKLIVGATTAEERLRVGGQALVSLALELSGIASLKVCF